MTTDSQFAGTNWTSISVELMLWFLGVILKMSFDNRELAGNSSYLTN